MREILFRGKRGDNGEWVEGYYFAEMGSFIKEKSSVVATATYLVNCASVGQYTGLTDKTGKKIFEGDVINGYSPSGKRNFNNGVVKWSELFVGWRVVDCCNGHNVLFGDSASEYEVVGNIYDNPELLDGGAEE